MKSTETVRNLTSMLTTVWHHQPHHNCDFIGKFSANVTKAETRKLVKRSAPKC